MINAISAFQIFVVRCEPQVRVSALRSIGLRLSNLQHQWTADFSLIQNREVFQNMDIHEYQAKEILSEFGIPTPRGGLAYSPEQAVYRANEMGGEQWLVKAQIHSGARGKAGGIVICSSNEDISNAADKLLGKRLITHQTGSQGKLVHRLYVEEAIEIANEYYIGFVLDRQKEQIGVIASSQGGVEIEVIAQSQPDSIVRNYC